VGTKVEIFNLVRELAKDGHAILYYSTDVEELVNICDQVCVMHDGKISVTLKGKDITKENIVLALVGEQVQNHNGEGA
jgi:ribose transport system ATP-binding protein